MSGRPSLRFSLVGPGRVGSSLAHWACGHGGRLDRVAGRDLAGAEALARTLGGAAVDLARLDSSDSDLLLIAVADPALPEVAERLARRRQAAVALHTSGSAPAETLAPLRAAGSAIGSLHPLKSFPESLPDPVEARGVVFGIDGDAEALRLAADLVASWGARTVAVPAAARLAYHLAATLASGGVVTLLAAADEIARRAGLPGLVLAGYIELAEGSLERAAGSRAVARAITGPVARGDRETVEAELASLRSSVPELAPLVVEVARATLWLRSRLEGGEEDEHRALGRALDEPA